VTRLEDDVRERFASIAAPDVPAPSAASLRKRANRIRTTRVVAAAASIAVVAAGVGITASLVNRTTHTEYAAGVVAIPGHVHGLPPKTAQWKFADTTLAGKHLVAVSFRNGTSICITGDGAGSCEPADQIPTSVADVGDSSDGAIRSVVGFVPESARTVAVHLGTRTSTVTAVRTPTSDTQRFFAAFFVKQSNDDRDQPVIGVFDAHGKPVAPAVPDEGPAVVLSRSHAPNLPAAQWALAVGDDGTTSIVYRRNDGAACMAVTGLRTTRLLVDYGPRCGYTVPAAARVLVEVKLPSGWIVMLGDAPSWADSILEWGPNGMSSFGPDPAPAAGDRRFWSLNVPPGAGSRIATCAAGNNCVTVADLAEVLPHP
jgi:hypothetical protein